MRKAANRTAFDFAKGEEEYIDGDEVVGLGTLGSKEGSGQLRVVAAASKVKLNAKQQKKYKGRLGGLASMGGGAVNGLSSSLAFTPVQVRGRTRPGLKVVLSRGAPAARRCLPRCTRLAHAVWWVVRFLSSSMALHPSASHQAAPVTQEPLPSRLPCRAPSPPPPNIQGIELSNPLAGRGPEADALKSGTESYFSERAGFKSAASFAPPRPK
jgi:hypothetical protein